MRRENVVLLNSQNSGRHFRRPVFKNVIMKKIFILALMAIAGTGVSAQVTKANLQASGLTCAMCSKAVFKALSGVPFVAKVEPNIKLSTYDLSFKPGSKIDFDALSKAVTDAGFSVSQLKVTALFKGTKVENDAHMTLNEQQIHFVNVNPQTLDGERTISLIDKGFIAAKDFRKYERMTTMKCYQSGMMNGQRVYHATL